VRVAGRGPCPWKRQGPENILIATNKPYRVGWVGERNMGAISTMPEEGQGKRVDEMWKSSLEECQWKAGEGHSGDLRA
jgi:hypothetical protein